MHCGQVGSNLSRENMSTVVHDPARHPCNYSVDLNEIEQAALATMLRPVEVAINGNA